MMGKTVGETVGVLELRLRARSILRRVREKHEAVNITDRGEIIARIVPIHASRASERAGVPEAQPGSSAGPQAEQQEGTGGHSATFYGGHRPK